MISVSELCRRAGVTRKTLFYYDRIGLLKPVKRVGRQQAKQYDETSVIRLREIRRYRSAGLSLSEIRRLLDEESADRLMILNTALSRLYREYDALSQMIMNLTSLIEKETTL
ncbi:MAG: MerR family transcriptional regulator [Solobacterium sp.]|nr:MerR family transcriptional regulator [Solobacterium sp.]